MGNYLYNGIKLPALPEWEKEGYSYLVIYHSINVGEYFALGYPVKPIVSGINYPQIKMGEDRTYRRSLFVENDSAWFNPDEIHNGDWSQQIAEIVWSNFDIKADDGTLYLAASDPVPGTVGNLEFIGTYSGIEKGIVQVNYEESYDIENDISTLKITSVKAKVTAGATVDYFVNGYVEVWPQNATGLLDKITFADLSVNFTSSNTYYTLGTDKTLEVKIANSSVVKSVDIKLTKRLDSAYGFLFSDQTSTTANDWNILTSNSVKTINLTIIDDTESEEPETPDIPVSSSKLNPNILFMGWSFARLVYQPLKSGINILSNNHLADINNLILKSKDDFYLVFNNTGG